MSDGYSDEQPPKAGINSPNNTNFTPKEAPADDQHKFEVLWFYNEDLKRDRTNFRSQEVRRREQNHILDAISSSVELPDYQHKEAQTIVEQTNFTKNVEGKYLSIETYCFAICIIVHNQALDRFSQKYIPDKSDASNPDIFVNFRDEAKLSDYDIEQALNELGYGVKENV